MLSDTVKRIEKSIAASTTLTSSQKSELSEMIGQLKSEVELLSRQSSDDAKSILDFTETSCAEVSRSAPGGERVKISSDGLRVAVEKYEASHPQLFQVVNSICNYLSGIGI